MEAFNYTRNRLKLYVSQTAYNRYYRCNDLELENVVSSK